MSWRVKWIRLGLGSVPWGYLKFVFVSLVSQTLMHIHVFAKQMYKYTLWVSENWYPLRKIYYKCLSVRLGQEKFSCVIFVSIDIWGDWATELYIEVWDVCHAGGGRQWGGRVASLARRNVRDWNFRWISLSLSLYVVIVKRWVVTTDSEDDQLKMKCNDW